jgi:tRNA(Ile)-lysidine synthase TilS/MesJ
MNTETTYRGWREENKSILRRFPGKRLFVMYSGGKDSSLCMHLMSRAGDEFGFRFEVHAGACPPHRYTGEEKERLGEYWHNKGVNIVWHDIGVRDEDLIASQNPCTSCQKGRKKVLNAILSQSVVEWANLVLIPGFTLWDIVGYCLEHVLANVFSRPEHREETETRFIEIAQRFYPLLKMKEGYTVFRPLLKFNGSEVVEFVRQEGIPILSIPCRFKDHRPKRVLEQYYESMRLRFDYDNVFEFAKTSLALPDMGSYASLDREEYIENIF